MKFKMPRERMQLADGTSLSVQASETDYCTPRNDEGPYSCVEVGFLKDRDGNRIPCPDSWLPYADDTGNPLSDVFGYIPVELVTEFINAHGGIVPFYVTF